MEQKFSHKILIVDDEKIVGKSLGRILKLSSLDSTYVESGDAAIEEIKSAKEPFSLIISDQRMPGMQGTDLLEQAKKITPDTIRFLLTGYSDMSVIIDSVNQGAVHKFINKPWDNDNLLELIKTYLNKYEEIMEGDRLLKTAKKQTKKLYEFGCEFMEIITAHDKKLADLDAEIQELEKQIPDQPSSALNFADKIEKQVEEAIMAGDKPDLEKTKRLYACFIKNLFDEFEEIANRNGFEMPQMVTGGKDD